MPHSPAPHDAAPDADRPFGPAMRRALRNRCPACGEGRMFGRFLKPVAACGHCGTAWDQHQADDFPSYVVILLLGHILVPIMAETLFIGLPMGVLMVLWPGLALLLAAALIQPAKGAVIAFQWSRRMHGFAG